MFTQKKRFFWLLGMVLIMTAVLAACSGGSGHILVAQYNNDLEAEIFLLQPGDDEDDWQSLGDDLVRGRPYFGSDFATFAPNDPDYVILYYEDRGDTVLEVLRIGADEPQEIHEIEGDFAFPRLFSDPFRITIAEFDGEENECYVSVRGEEAERIAEVSICDFYEEGVLLTERDDDETTARVVDFEGEEVGIFFEELDDVEITSVNQELTRLLFVERDGAGGQIFIVELDEEPEEVGDEFDWISSVRFLDDERFFYIASEDEDDDPLLFISDQEEPVAEDIDTTLFTRIDLEGGNVAFMVDEGSDQGLNVYNARSEEVVEVAEEDEILNVQFSSTDPPRLLAVARDRDEIKLISAEPDGSDALELFAADDTAIRRVYYLEDGETLVIHFEDEDGQGLFITPVDAAEGIELLQEWDALLPRAMTADQLVLVGIEDRGDDPVLYSIALEEDAELVELDDDIDDDQQVRALFVSANGRDALYTVSDPDPDDYEIRQVPLDGEEAPETIAAGDLLAVQWDSGALRIFQP